MRLEMAGDRLRGEPFSQEMIHVSAHLLAGHLVQGYGEPGGKVGKDVHVVLYRMGREVPSL